MFAFFFAFRVRSQKCEDFREISLQSVPRTNSKFIKQWKICAKIHKKRQNTASTPMVFTKCEIYAKIFCANIFFAKFRFFRFIHFREKVRDFVKKSIFRETFCSLQTLFYSKHKVCSTKHNNSKMKYAGLPTR